MGAAEGCGSSRRIALLLEYDGTAYRGSQYQQNGPSIQAVLEAAINNLTRETARVAFAGRTDAGVHALGQVAAFDTNSTLGVREVVRGLNHFLPADVVVVSGRSAETRFDPRREAKQRAYRYRISNRSQRLALDRDRAWQVAKPLAVEAMAEAAAMLEGKHDFAAFSPPTDKLTARTLRRCEVSGQTGVEVTVEMEAEAFLPHQVRRTVGPLVEVGVGRMTVDELRRILEAAVPSSAQPAAPTHGLYLVRVEYDGFAFEPEEREEGE
jgi:tRNA pseudouridine38-40 synthase